MSQAEILADSDRDQDKIDRCVQAVITAIEADVDFRLPETETNREAALAAWLHGCHQQLEPLMLGEAQREFASLPQAMIQSMVDDLVWLRVAHQLRSYYIRYRAAAWRRQHMGDATILGSPIFHDPLWYVPVGVRRYGMGFGQIVLDSNGTVIPDKTTTREQMLARINDRESPATPSANAQ